MLVRSVAALVGVALGGCQRPPLPVLAASAPSSSERRPDAARLEPESARPSPVARAEAHGVVSLGEPVGAAAIAQFVQTFVDAWRRESLDDLDSLLSQGSDVGPIEAPGRGREAVVENWRQRLKAHAHEYARLESDLVAVERIEHWDSDDLGRVRGGLPQTTLRMGDVYASVPIRVSLSGSERLFGNFLVMVLRREKGDLRVVAYGETDERPSH
jgi:hypothetical protein